MEWEHTSRNLARFEPAVAEAKADIVVLPEMFATGFKLRPAVVAEPMDGEVGTAGLANTARRWSAAPSSRKGVSSATDSSSSSLRAR